MNHWILYYVPRARTKYGPFKSSAGSVWFTTVPLAESRIGRKCAKAIDVIKRTIENEVKRQKHLITGISGTE